MSDAEREQLCAIGILVSSTVYLVLVTIAATIDPHPWALRLAIATAGVNYLSYFVQMQPKPCMPFVLSLVVLSVVCGAAAGINLLW